MRESGYPGDKVAIEARWAEGRPERLPKLAAELVELRVAAIVGSVEAALAAKKATTFSTIARSGVGALLMGAGPFLNSRRSQLVGLAALHAIPTSYFERGFVDAGGLVSYGASQTDAYRRAGIYVARILNGEKLGDLPVELPTKYEMVINLKVAKVLGLTVPPALVARADDVIQ